VKFCDTTCAGAALSVRVMVTEVSPGLTGIPKDCAVTRVQTEAVGEGAVFLIGAVADISGGAGPSLSSQDIHC
jgi:hypothetical protein